MEKLKEWLFKTFVADSLFRAGYAKLDAALSARWPAGWKRIQFALRGWVTKLGIVISAAAGATLWLAPQMSAEDAARLVLWVGVGVTAVGLLRKGVKWFVYFEATDKDGWLDMPKMPKPEGLSGAEKALLAGKLQDVKADLKDAAETVDEVRRDVGKFPSRRK